MTFILKKVHHSTPIIFVLCNECDQSNSTIQLSLNHSFVDFKVWYDAFSCSKFFHLLKATLCQNLCFKNIVVNFWVHLHRKNNWINFILRWHSTWNHYWSFFILKYATFIYATLFITSMQRLYSSSNCLSINVEL